MSAFIIVIFAFWFYPLLAYVAVTATTNQPSERRFMVWIMNILGGLSVLSLLTGISTTSRLLDWFLLTTIYGSACLMIWIYRLEWGKKGHFLGGIAQLSIFGMGYVFSTAGFIGLGFIVAAYVPTDERNVGDGLIYKEIPLGSAASEIRLKRMELTQTLPLLPVLERTIISKVYDASDELMAPPFGVYYHQQRQQLCLSASHLSEDTHRVETWSDTLEVGK